HLLCQEPKHFLMACRFGEPWKERIALAGSPFLKLLEPRDEIVHAAWHVSYKRTDLPPHRLDIVALGTRHYRLFVELLAPSVARKAGPKLPRIVFREFSLKSVECRALKLGGSFGP